MAIADMEYRGEKKTIKQAYKHLRQLAHIQGKKRRSNLYPSAIKEIQGEERPHVCDQFFNTQILEIARKIKEERAIEMRDRFGEGGWFLAKSSKSINEKKKNE